MSEAVEIPTSAEAAATGMNGEAPRSEASLPAAAAQDGDRHDAGAAEVERSTTGTPGPETSPAGATPTARRGRRRENEAEAKAARIQSEERARAEALESLPAPEGVPDTASPRAIILAQLREAMRAKTILSVPVVLVRDNLIYVHLDSFRAGGDLFGVMTPEEFDDRQYPGYDGFVGRQVDVVITGLDPKTGLVRVSRREALARKREQLFRVLQVGQIVNGIVRTVRERGVWVDVGGADAFIPPHELAHEWVDDPRTVLRRGEWVPVKITHIDPENRRIRASRREALPEPWERVRAVYERNTVTYGKIVGQITTPSGIGLFVRPEPSFGVDILCGAPATNARPSLPRPDGALANPLLMGPWIRRPPLTVGQAVRVEILRVDPETKRLRGRILGPVA